MKRVLIVKMWALGDILMATPMIAALRARYPNVNITWLVETSHREILQDHPGIDEVFSLDSEAWRRFLKQGRLGAWLAQALVLRVQMRRKQFDAVINCQADKGWSSILCAAPVRVGLFPTSALPRTRRHYTHALNRPSAPPVHNTDHYLSATRALGCPDADRHMTVGQTVDEEPYWRAFCDIHHIVDRQSVVMISPFSNGANRCWEPERYAQLADFLAATHASHVVLTYGAGDQEAAQRIAQGARTKIILAGGTTLREYISLIRHANLVISSDSSAMHLAAAVDTPFVALFGPTPVFERFPIVGSGTHVSHPLPCAPCDRATCANPVFRECMKLISVRDVQEASSILLNRPLRR